MKVGELLDLLAKQPREHDVIVDLNQRYGYEWVVESAFSLNDELPQRPVFVINIGTTIYDRRAEERFDLDVEEETGTIDLMARLKESLADPRD